MKVGILGSMVWDRIEHPDGPAVERWGGIAYAVAAAAAALPTGWSIRPIIQVGRDLDAEARAFLGRLPGLEQPGGVTVVDAPNNRVHLRYVDRHRRRERLAGGVPPWTWGSLEPRLAGLDALYVNLISGFELDLGTAGRLRGAFAGPVYADLHSLLLGVGPEGEREPRPLPDADRWLAAFDVVQVNADELSLLAGDGDPVRAAEAAVEAGLGALLVTRGPEGALWFAAADRPAPWRPGGGAGVARRGAVPAPRPATSGDPTGCGDVWGATCFIELVRGRTLSEAMDRANRAAGRKLSHRGADDLYRHLRTDP